MAAGLFAEIGYRGVWAKLTAGLGGLPVHRIAATALWQARVRVGVAPLRALFDLLRGPAAGIRTIDGTVLDVPDTPWTRC